MGDLDPFGLSLWALRLGFVGLLYLFFFLIARAMWRDLRSSVRTAGQALARLVVVAAPEGNPPPGTTLPLDAVNTLGRDVNNSIVIEDSFASAEHAVLTFRGRAWYLEDRGSTNGTWVNGYLVNGAAPVAFGDEIQVGQVRMRLDRPLAA